MRCLTPNATSGALRREFFASSTSGSIWHDPSATDRSRNLPDPVRDLCVVLDRNALRCPGSVLLAVAAGRQARAGVAAAGRRQFLLPCGILRRTSGVDLHAG